MGFRPIKQNWTVFHCTFDHFSPVVLRHSWLGITALIEYDVNFLNYNPI